MRGPGVGLRRWSCAALLGVCSCSMSVDADRPQCASNADCAARGAAFAGSVCVNSLCQADSSLISCVRDEDCAAQPGSVCVSSFCQSPWGCLDTRRPPGKPGEAPTGGPWQVKVIAQDMVTRKLLAKVDVKLCRKLEPNCNNPVGTSQTDDNGETTFEVAADFAAGWVWLTRDDLMPASYFFHPPIDRNGTVTVNLATPTVVNLLITEGLKKTFMPERGLVLLSTENCLGQAAAGVALEAASEDASITRWYSVGEFPNILATATDAQGFGGFINVPAEPLEVTGRLEANGRKVGTVGLNIKAGAISESRMVPLGE
jgi:hypothetical protein